MALTDVQIRNTKPNSKIQRLYDEKGLYLEVAPNGGRWWRFKFRFQNKEKRLSLGVYPEVKLKEARDRRDEYRKLVSNGVDPSELRKITKADTPIESGNTFEFVAREWYLRFKSSWSPSHAKKVLQLFERDLFPWLKDAPLSEISPVQLLTVLRRIESRGALETAHRALGHCGQVLRYGVATGRASRDMTQDLRGALPPYKRNHFAAETDPKRFGQYLKIIHGYEGMFHVQCALKLAPLVFVRPGELRKAKWEDIDFEAAEWRFIVTKTQTAHIVSLARQAVVTLKELYPLTADSEYVFPSMRSKDRPMSDNAVLAALRRLGISKEELSGHGFRATARTLLDEVLGFRPDFIEHQLAHAVRDPLGRAYNCTVHLDERRKMMQAWADYLDRLMES